MKRRASNQRNEATLVGNVRSKKKKKRDDDDDDDFDEDKDDEDKAGNKGEKEKRNQQQQLKQKGQRPDPPPPPPASLVKLLQKDRKVLKYFQSLQENLDYDVQKWKTRAREYESKYKEVAELSEKQKAKATQTQNNHEKTKDERLKQTEEILVLEEKDSTSPPAIFQKHHHKHHQTKQGVDIDDSMFDDYLSSSDEEKQNEKNRHDDDDDDESDDNEMENSKRAAVTMAKDRNSNSDTNAKLDRPSGRRYGDKSSGDDCNLFTLDASSQSEEEDKLETLDHDDAVSDTIHTNKKFEELERYRQAKNCLNKLQLAWDCLLDVGVTLVLPVDGEDEEANRPIKPNGETDMACSTTEGTVLTPTAQTTTSNTADTVDTKPSTTANDRNDKGRNLLKRGQIVPGGHRVGDEDDDDDEEEEEENGVRKKDNSNHDDKNNKKNYTSSDEVPNKIQQHADDSTLEHRQEDVMNRKQRQRQIIYRRRPDQLVVVDLLQAIKTVTRVKYCVKVCNANSKSKSKRKGKVPHDVDDEESSGPRIEAGPPNPPRQNVLIPDHPPMNVPTECNKPTSIPEASTRSDNYYYYCSFMTAAILPCYQTVPRHFCSFSDQDDDDDEGTGHKDEQPLLQHPAVEALKSIQTALCWMDLYCPILEDHEETSRFGCNNGAASDSSDDSKNILMNIIRSETMVYTQQLILGMKGRHIMVDNLIRSLEGEIATAWAYQDRAMRLLTVAQHFDPQHNDDGDDDDIDDFEDTFDRRQTNGNDYDGHDDGNGSTDKDEKSFLLDRVIPFGPKNLVRLAALVERCMLAKIVIGIHVFRQDPEYAMNFFVSYIISSVPSLQLEEYPKLPPVLSLCVIEAMLEPLSIYLRKSGSVELTVTTGGDQDDTTSANEKTVNYQSSHNLMDWLIMKCHDTSSSSSSSSSSTSPSTFSLTNSTHPLSAHVFSLVLATTASIYKTRQKSLDDRITDISRVELAAYKRLLQRHRLLTTPTPQQQAYIYSGPSERHTQQQNEQQEQEDAGGVLSLSVCREKVSNLVAELLDDDATLADIQRIRGVGVCAFASLLRILFLLWGDGYEIDKVLEGVLTRLPPSILQIAAAEEAIRYEKYSHTIMACTLAKKGMEIRQIDSYRETITSSHTNFPKLTGSKSLQYYSTRIANYITSDVPVDGHIEKHSNSLSSVIDMAISCCRELSDGESLMRIIEWCYKRKTLSLPPKSSTRLHHKIADTIEHAMVLPTVRVINLQRRPDRMAAFMAQALHEGLLVVKAVVSNLGQNDLIVEEVTTSGRNLSPPGRPFREDSCHHHYFGGYAIDGGQGTVVQVEDRLTKLVEEETHDGTEQQQEQQEQQQRESQHQYHRHFLTELVATHWRPSNLKPFDTEAPDDSQNIVVRLSPSEKACALSHIAAWKGVVRSLTYASSISNDNDNDTRDFIHSQGTLLRNPSSMLRHFHIGGFARGAALMVANSGMEPTPVCVILEDDAVLVDRFADRLQDLLDELPRDFHFCSLGYSRPRTAPLLRYTSHVGIPTAIWYLTGYIVSLEGARFLLKNLPVRGPVDSWIGLSMFSNWDNVFGHALGVGVHAKSFHEPTITVKELRQVLRFRAFAAAVPLCSQKVGAAATTTTAASSADNRRTWRQRDTDITYSGSPS